MTWDFMSHTDAEFKGIVVDDKKKPIGFTLKGMTYDGDGNPQWEMGTEMEITMKNEQEFKEFIKALNTIEFEKTTGKKYTTGRIVSTETINYLKTMVKAFKEEDFIKLHTFLQKELMKNPNERTDEACRIVNSMRNYIADVVDGNYKYGEGF